MDTLEKKHDDELAALDKKYDDIIKGLDYNDAAVAGQFITEVKQADGAIEVKRAALTAADIPELAQSKITGLVDKLAEIDQAILDAEGGALQDAKDYSDAQLKAKVESLDYTDAAVAKQFVTSVSEADGIIAVTRAALVATDIPVIEQTQVNGLGDALAAAGKAGTDAAAQALTDAKAYADKKVEDLDYEDAEVAKNFVTEVKQTDGAIAVKRAPVADIALTGNVNDLIQTTGDVLVFNCGNSAVDTAYEFVK
jgi:ribosomal protein S18